MLDRSWKLDSRFEPIIVYGWEGGAEDFVAKAIIVGGPGAAEDSDIERVGPMSLVWKMYRLPTFLSSLLFLFRVAMAVLVKLVCLFAMSHHLTCQGGNLSLPADMRWPILATKKIIVEEGFYHTVLHCINPLNFCQVQFPCQCISISIP